jgi:hypothetical protein
MRLWGGGAEESVSYCCPVTRTKLMLRDGTYYTESGMLAYPIIFGIPCLRSENAIIAVGVAEG